MTDDEVERLKQHHLRSVRDDGRTHLPTLGVPPPPDEPIDEAFGGSGEKPAAPIDPAAVRERIVETLKQVYDPEIPVNIYDLGLIYGIDVAGDGGVEIQMTLTAPACPVAGSLVRDVAHRVGEVDGVSTSHVTLVWEPPWTQDRMTEEARLELGLL